MPENEITRRHFLKVNSAFWITQVILNDPALNLFNKGIGLDAFASSEWSFSLEVIRSVDLLQLKYFFYNATIKDNMIRSVNGDYVFVCILLPSQHIAETMVTGSDDFHSKDDFSIQNSFLAGKSWLAFKLNGDYTNKKTGPSVNLDLNTLLNWSGYLDLVTLNDFATINKQNTILSKFPAALKDLTGKFNGPDGAHQPVRLVHPGTRTKKWPVTTFEIPYKLRLSPIAEPAVPVSPDDHNFDRLAGEHYFTGDNQLKSYYEEDSGNRKIHIVVPWQNTLLFKDFLTGTDHQPRFKAVQALCAEKDIDGNADILPSPFNRAELNGLTMLPNYDRDIRSDYFNLSAYGSTASLKYRNDDPLEYAMIAWEQKTKYARDNHIVVTYRAIDYFTGLKLEVSIIADREFAFGVSFLPKRYYVSFAEKQKNYNEAIVISQIPFTTVIPRTKGAYFIPQSLHNSGGQEYNIMYVVGNGKAIDNADKVQPGGLLSFDYVGIDKEGKQHNFNSRMIIIMAEIYHITEGSYNRLPNPPPRVAVPPKPNPTPVPAGQNVGIQDIGYLLPELQSKFKGKTPPNCTTPPDPKYWWQLQKTFSPEKAPGVQVTLDAISKHVDANIGFYKIAIGESLTYAKLDKLKSTQAIKSDSQNATFKTLDILLKANHNADLFSAPAAPETDLFFNNFPIIPTLHTANVIIPQLDQIEGSNIYHAVSYYTSYIDGRADIDDDLKKGSNDARIFFSITTAVSNFFHQNYRGSGAMVDPGLVISHVSAYDNSITFNNSMRTQPDTLAKTGAPAFSAVSNVSIFRDVNAQILGIPVLDIVAEMLPVGDIPAFSFAQQLNNDIGTIKGLAGQYARYVGTWENDYNTLLADIQKAQAAITQAQQALKLLSKGGVRNWTDTLIKQATTRDLSKSRLVALAINTTVYSDYIDKILVPIQAEINKSQIVPDPTKPNNQTPAWDYIRPLLDNLLSNPTQTNLTALLLPVKTAQIAEQYFKEGIKSYYAKSLLSANDGAQKIGASLAAYTDSKNPADSRVTSYFNAYLSGLQEATLFCPSYAEQQTEQFAQTVDDVMANIPQLIVDLLKEGGLKWEDLENWIIQFNQLISVYDRYYQLYLSLKREYYTGLGIVHDFTALTKLEAGLVTTFLQELNSFNIPIAPANVRAAFKKLLDSLIGLTRKNNVLSDYINLKNGIAADLSAANQTYTKLFDNLYSAYDKALADLLTTQTGLADKQTELRNFMQNEIALMQQKLNNNIAALANQVKGSPAYQQAQKDIGQLTAFINQIRSLSKLNLEYTFKTKQFKNASLGGVIEFIPDTDKTQLLLNVNYAAQLNITNLNAAPSITKSSFTTDVTLSNFKIGLLGLLYVDFDNVRFMSSSDAKDNFTVKIRGVDFGGFLGFFEVFESWLKSLTDDIAFDINTIRAQISYALAIPNITTGYFNFFNLSLSTQMILPFDPDQSMQLLFGIGNEQNKFGLTLMGIFGGQGYFNIIADPKKGIRGMVIVLEFGAIFNLDITVATGTAYLVGGIYIRKYDDQYDLRAYILCVGKLSVLGIFSASMTFYMGLEGNSQVISGRCTITVSFKLGPFFEISVDCTMEKQIAGTKSADRTNNNSTTATAAVTADENNLTASSARAHAIGLIDSNLDQHQFFNDESLKMTVTTQPDVTAGLNATISNGTMTSPLGAKKVSLPGQDLTYFDLKLDQLDPGQYTVSVANGGRSASQVITILHPDGSLPAAKTLTDQTGVEIISTVTSASYYRSYYQKN